MARRRIEVAMTMIDRFADAVRNLTVSDPRGDGQMTISTSVRVAPAPGLRSVLATRASVVPAVTTATAVPVPAATMIFARESVTARVAAPPQVTRDEAMDRVASAVTATLTLVSVPLGVPLTARLGVEMAPEVPVATLVRLETAVHVRVVPAQHRPLPVGGEPLLVSPPRVKPLVVRPKKARRVVSARAGCATTHPAPPRRPRARSARSRTPFPLISPQRYADHLPVRPINANVSSRS